jgi:hypothetical protein
VSYGDQRPDRQVWPAKPTQTRPAATPVAAPDDTAAAARDLPTDVHPPVTAPPAYRPPASPWSPPPTQPIRPTEPTESTEPRTPTQPTEPRTPTQPTEPRPPTEPPTPTAPAAPRIPPTARPDERPGPGPHRRRLAFIGAGLLAALLAGTLVVAIWPSGDPSPVSATPGPGATASRGALANAEQPVVGDTASPAPSQSPSPTPKAKPSPSTTPAPVAARDDFTAAALDKSRWAVYGTSGPGAYESDMVRVSAGELQILGVGRNPTAAANKSGGLCWCVDGNHRYGSWQVRAKFDAGSGYRQVLELWPQSDSSTTDGSINFASDGDAAKKVLGVVLQPPANGGAPVHTSRDGDFTGWHVYRVDWRATFVRMYLDDVLIYDSSTSAGITIPHTPMHLVIQQDKGPGNGIPAANAQTPAQVVMHVDWVRYDP